MLIQSIFYPLEMFATRRRGVALRATVDGPRYLSASYGEADEIDCSAILDGDQLHVFATNRHLDEPATVTIAVADRKITRGVDADILTGPDAKAENSFEFPTVIQSVPLDGVAIDDGVARVAMPPLSFAATTFELQ